MTSHALSSAIFLFLLLPVLSHAVRLTRAITCPAAAMYFRSNALSRVGPYGLKPLGFAFPFEPIDVSMEDGSAPSVQSSTTFGGNAGSGAPLAGADTAMSAPLAGVDFSETNVQVEGVDEPDIIKTDGRRIFTVRSGTLVVADVLDDGAAGAVTGKLKLPLYAFEMLIQGDNLLLIASDFGQVRPTPPPGPGVPVFPFENDLLPETDEIIASAEPEESPSEEVLSSSESEPLLVEPSGEFVDRSFVLPPTPGGMSITVLYRVDVSSSTPRLMETLRLGGDYVSSRDVKGVARIVIRGDQASSLPFVYPNATLTDDEATEENKKVIENTSTETWLPRYWIAYANCKSAPGSACFKEGLLTACDRVFTPDNVFGGFSTVTVVTVSLTSTIEPRDSVSIVSDAQEVYATATSMYLTTQPYQFDFVARMGNDSEEFPTTVHKFKLGASETQYIASGEVKGSLLNQFSMHEYNGTFFIATTEGAFWFAQRDTSKSKITSLVVDDGKLVKKGEVGNLGLGERIFAVRYVESTAYVVTFREVDPLYIIDLARPTMLRVTGELKIPGFSSYLHLVGPGRILGVGQEATAQGTTTGAKVTLFDVSNVSMPTELSTWTLPRGFTDAEWDHRAFLFWEPESVAVMPVSVYSRNGMDEFTGSIVLEISESAITERGRVTHPRCCGNPGFPSYIERNLVLGRTNLWSLSEEYLQINNISTLQVESIVPLAPST